MLNAKKQEKKLIAYIDHWVEYKKRFLKDNKLIRPDEIWVSDKYAFFEAKKIISRILRLRKSSY